MRTSSRGTSDLWGARYLPDCCTCLDHPIAWWRTRQGG